MEKKVKEKEEEEVEREGDEEGKIIEIYEDDVKKMIKIEKKRG